MLSNTETVHYFPEKKMNIQYFEEVLEYKIIPSLVFNSNAVCLICQEMDIWGLNRLIDLNSIF